MLRAILFALALLLGGALVGWWIAKDAGYVLIAYSGLAWESSLWFSLLLVSAALLVLAFIYKLVFGVFNLPGHLGHWWHARRKDRRESRYDRALLQLAGGDAKSALATLASQPGNIRGAFLAFEASLRVHNYRAATRHLEVIKKGGRRSLKRNELLLLNLMEARICLAMGKYQRAFTLIKDRLGRPLKADDHVSRLALAICRRGEMWDELGELLPISGADDFAEEYRLYFKNAKDVAKLRARWSNLTKKWRNALLLTYAERLRASGYDDDAEGLVRPELQQRPDDELVYMYGAIRSSHSIKQLHTLEELVRSLPPRRVSTAMLFTLAELCLRNRMWAQANGYYEKLVRDHQPGLDQLAAGLKKVLISGEAKDKNKARQLLDQALRTQLPEAAT